MFKKIPNNYLNIICPENIIFMGVSNAIYDCKIVKKSKKVGIDLKKIESTSGGWPRPTLDMAAKILILSASKTNVKNKPRGLRL